MCLFFGNYFVDFIVMDLESIVLKAKNSLSNMRKLIFNSFKAA